MFDFVIKLLRHNPDAHYADWGLTLTSNGWVLIEGNPKAQFLSQISEQKGFRDELMSILRSCGLNYEMKLISLIYLRCLLC